MEDIVAFVVLICFFKPMGVYPQPALDLEKSRVASLISCRYNEYPHDNICCLNCPAGKHLKSPCTRAQEMGTCEECDFGTFIEYPNGLPRCFKCTQCRSDQEMVRACSHKQDSECQCKSGKFCDPHRPCEVCKKCTRCKSDEELVRNCTPTTDTECKKKQPSSDTGIPPWLVAIAVLAPAALAALAAGVFCVKKKNSRTNDSLRNPGGERKAVAPAITSAPKDDEHRRLCETPSSSASNSQHSLFDQQATSIVLMEPPRREHEPFPTLVPVNGEESLRTCFELFSNLDMDQYKRFFRQLDLSDNVIKSKDGLPYEDRIHDLLNIWVEQEGRRASLNDLLKTLLNLNQRRTAEDIKNAAIDRGLYSCASSDPAVVPSEVHNEASNEFKLMV